METDEAVTVEEIANATERAFGGYRNTVEITETGPPTCIELLNALSGFRQSV